MTAPSNCQLSLFVSCDGIPDRAGDVRAVLLEFTPQGKTREVGKTEAVSWSQHLSFNQPIRIEYLFETRQKLRLMFVADGCNVPVAHVEFLLSAVMTTHGHTKELHLSLVGTTATVSAVDHSITREDTLAVRFEVEDLASGCCGDPTTYFTLTRLIQTGQRVKVFQSDNRRETCSPSWGLTPPIRLAELMGKSRAEKTLEFTLYRVGTFGDAAVGHTLLSVDMLQQSTEEGMPGLRHSLVVGVGSTSAASRGGHCVGYLRISGCQFQKSISFANLLTTGWQVNLLVSIDFTASNGDPRDAKSLHHIDAQQPAATNQYLKAIVAVGEVLLEYDTDKMIAAYGFGAEMPDRRTSHFFHLNFSPDPYVAGIDGLVGAYASALRSVRLSGPTNFAPTIHNVLAGVRQAERDHIYTILLIITDGDINDIDETIDEIVAADDAALSIIIVGVGSEAEFTSMIQLDGDIQPLVSRKGKQCRRDLVQFVAMRDFERQPAAALAAEVLREIPAQVERWAVLSPVLKLDAADCSRV